MPSEIFGQINIFQENIMIILLTIFYVYFCSANSWTDSVLALLAEILRTDLFFQEAWDLPNVWVQLQEENKTFRRVEMCIFKILVSHLNYIA